MILSMAILRPEDPLTATPTRKTNKAIRAEGGDPNNDEKTNAKDSAASGKGRKRKGKKKR